MHRPRWFRTSRYIPAVFLGTMCILGGALAWLCWQLLEQDRQLEAQRTQERLDQVADRTVNALQSSLLEFDTWLPPAVDTRTEPPPAGIALLRKSDRGVEVLPAGRVLYFPAAAPAERNREDVFAEGERLEFQGRDPQAAAEIFRALTTSRDPETRAGALLRLGRNLRKLGRLDEALATYRELGTIPKVGIEGVPLELTAWNARCSVLAAMGRQADLKKEALLLDTGLRSGRWQLSSAVWDFQRNAVRGWADPPPLTENERQGLEISRAVEWLSQLWPRPLEPKGKRLMTFENGPALLSWSADSMRLSAIVVTSGRLKTLWNHARPDGGVLAALMDSNGNLAMGDLNSHSRRRALRSLMLAGLPATVVVTQRDEAEDFANAAIRRRFFLAGFALLAMVLAGGSYFTVRSMARESATARMQSEFVSNVSHELRTPLTSLRQLSEMLVHDRIGTEAERRESYGVLFHASERLQRLVESLLDFGRMEANAFRYQFEEVDVADLVNRTVEEFRRQAAQGYEVEVTLAENLPPIRGDREALGVALWNLLDNAVKYSPNSRTIRVETSREGDAIAIAVHDRGLGIDPREQRHIFDKFVRGSEAWKSHIKGTGIGLSMARHIAQAHGGDIRVVSQPGKGSTFTLSVPIEKTA